MRLLPSQILILATMLVFGIYTLRLRSLLRDRVILSLLVVTGIFLAIQPDISTRVANRLGIGRGVDLLFYTFIIFSLFVNAHNSWRLRRLDQQVTQLARSITLELASPAGGGGPRDRPDADLPDSGPSAGPTAQPGILAAPDEEGRWSQS